MKLSIKEIIKLLWNMSGNNLRNGNKKRMRIRANQY